MSVSEFTQQDYDLIARDFADLKEAAIKRCSNSSEIDVIQRAFEFANAAHKNVRRRSGEPYMIHPIAVAKIVVSDIGLGYKSITAALLHDVVEDTDFTVEDISRMFGEKIASLVDGLTKIKTVLDNQDKNHLGGDVYIQSLQALEIIISVLVSRSILPVHKIIVKCNRMRHKTECCKLDAQSVGHGGLA